MEQWKKIQDEPIYSVSSKGSIKNNQTDHIKSLRLDKDGYQRVTLYPSGKTYRIHSLVMKILRLNQNGKNKSTIRI